MSEPEPSSNPPPSGGSGGSSGSSSSAPPFQFKLGEHFNLALIAVVIYSIELVIIAFCFPGRARSKVFTKEFMTANFDEEHRDATYQSVEKSNGYPDMGAGRYADQLPYHQWLYFNKAQRVHYNFLENWGPQVVFILIGALSFPLSSAILEFCAIFFRLLYSFGYMQSGGNASPLRAVGAIFGDLVLLATFGLALYTCISPYFGHSSGGSSQPAKPAEPAQPAEPAEPSMWRSRP